MTYAQLPGDKVAAAARRAIGETAGNTSGATQRDLENLLRLAEAAHAAGALVTVDLDAFEAIGEHYES